MTKQFKKLIVVDNKLILLEQGAHGIHTFEFESKSKKWKPLAFLIGFDNMNGWEDEKYSSTLQAVTIKDQIYLVGRGKECVYLSKYDPKKNTWVWLPEHKAFTDQEGWWNKNHYSTLQAIVINNNLYLLCRGSNAIYLSAFNAETNTWATLQSHHAFVDKEGWWNKKHYSTLQAIVIGNNLYVLGRGSNAIYLTAYNPETNTWLTLPPHQAFTDQEGWWDERYYSTLRSTVINGQLYLLGRGSNALYLSTFNPKTNVWIKLPPQHAFSDQQGWGERKFYSTLQYFVMDNALLLCARGSNGMQVHTYNPNTPDGFNRWEFSHAVPYLTDQQGWSDERYYSTLQTIEHNKKLFLVGYGASEVHLFEYDPSIKKWQIMDFLPYATYRKTLSARARLKQLERDRVLALPKDEKGALLLDEKDEQGNTALHRAAKTGRLKDCARLLFLGASGNIKNSEHKLPLALSHLHVPTGSSLDDQQDKIRKLRIKILKLKSDLSQTAAHILSRRNVMLVAAEYDEKVTEKALAELYKLREIAPLMDLAKLAALGLHDLSKRKKFEVVEYDSDDDADDTPNENECLQIALDIKKNTVHAISYWGDDGQSGEKAGGVYTYHNTVFVAVGSIHEEVAKGILIHELTHFIADEIYKNICNPYSKTDETTKAKFDEITKYLLSNKQRLDPKLQEVFGSDEKGNPYYTEQEYHRELIVRVPQMIVEYKDGLTRIQNQAPALWEYYNNVFLVAVKNHTEMLERRALSNWPTELFAGRYENQWGFTDPTPSQVQATKATQTDVAAPNHAFFSQADYDDFSDNDDEIPDAKSSNTQPLTKTVSDQKRNTMG